MKTTSSAGIKLDEKYPNSFVQIKFIRYAVDLALGFAEGSLMLISLFYFLSSVFFTPDVTEFHWLHFISVSTCVNVFLNYFFFFPGSTLRQRYSQVGF